MATTRKKSPGKKAGLTPSALKELLKDPSIKAMLAAAAAEASEEGEDPNTVEIGGLSVETFPGMAGRSKAKPNLRVGEAAIGRKCTNSDQSRYYDLLYVAGSYGTVSLAKSRITQLVSEVSILAEAFGIETIGELDALRSEINEALKDYDPPK